jgi:DNA-binding NarL/FixJ family response regulator
VGKIKIIIGEDNLILRADLCEKLKKDPNILIAGEYIDGDELVIDISRMLPEIILLNPRLPHLNIKALIGVVYKEGYTKILLFKDIFGSDNMVIELMCSGIHGIISRNIPEDLLIKAIYKVVIDDEIWIDRRTVTRLILNTFLRKDRTENEMNSEWLDPLVTRREKMVIGLISKGLSNKEIADRFCITEKTVKTHLTNIYQKLKVNNRRELRVYINSFKKTYP